MIERDDVAPSDRRRPWPLDRSRGRSAVPRGHPRLPDRRSRLLAPRGAVGDRAGRRDPRVAPQGRRPARPAAASSRRVVSAALRRELSGWCAWRSRDHAVAVLNDVGETTWAEQLARAETLSEVRRLARQALDALGDTTCRRRGRRSGRRCGRVRRRATTSPWDRSSPRGRPATPSHAAPAARPHSPRPSPPSARPNPTGSPLACSLA